ncbi:hypothetical protein C8N46_10617 [Kordia periserrulae]|uniref:Outer membrane protein with beta-barrel domain n=1 Tax=Kordia periserrulae TaxID=701523 RepID=A0A2T6BWD7_9FLAO|nr:hypothetical protein [Kordia periserrulae]PTX60373.1 hypothetical protein C8N46_10617 [Kordia periserrulae]
MSDQHNIDNFFRNRFKDFEATPDPELWNKISDKLDEKEAEKDEKGIVFLPWLYRIAGIAAAIALLFVVGNSIFNNDDSSINDNKNTITKTEKKNSSDENTTGIKNDTQLTKTDNNVPQHSSQEENTTIPENELLNKEQIADDNSVRNNKNSIQKQQNSTTTQGNALQNGVAQQDNSSSNSQNSVTNRDNNANLTQQKTLKNTENAVTNATNDANKIREKRKRYNGENYKINGKGDYVSGEIELKNAVADNQKNSEHKELSNTENKNSSNVNANTNAVTNTTESAIAQNITEKNETSETTETAVAEVKKDEKIGKSILEVINDLHDLENEKTDVAEVPFSRWTVSPNASPVYYNTFGNGSPIHETFEDNTKTGDINLSYGVNVGYDVSKRLTVRSGIHRVDYSYSTKDIAVVPSIDGPAVTTIQFRTNNASFDIKDREAPTSEAFSQYQLPTTESSIFQKQIEGDLRQRMSFVEVPVEVKYAVVDKKIGINVIGGVSTLLLTDNSIILDSPELLTELGEATNVNDISFSTNIGLGIDYKFSDQLEFNVEPMLKYQLNTFSGNSGNFNPYSVGVYTGVSFRF